MNWEKLNTDYPKASNMMYKWIKENRGKFEGVWMRFSIHKIGKVDNFFTPHGYRWLYDFFSAQEIECNPNLSDLGYTGFTFFSVLDKVNGNAFFCNVRKIDFKEPTLLRELAEEQMFESCFVWLERDLTFIP